MTETGNLLTGTLGGPFFGFAPFGFRQFISFTPTTAVRSPCSKATRDAMDEPTFHMPSTATCFRSMFMSFLATRIICRAKSESLGQTAGVQMREQGSVSKSSECHCGFPDTCKGLGQITMGAGT